MTWLLMLLLTPPACTSRDITLNKTERRGTIRYIDLIIKNMFSTIILYKNLCIIVHEATVANASAIIKETEKIPERFT
ncbi:MAG: hypothetical protein NUV76_11535, partial [Candidatus Kuenenia sp.]|nr:hypothetical protein [Candidatus Kuenenia sp.]